MITNYLQGFELQDYKYVHSLYKLNFVIKSFTNNGSIELSDSLTILQEESLELVAKNKYKVFKEESEDEEREDSIKVPAIYVANNQQLMNKEITLLSNGKYLASGSTLNSASLKKNLKALYVESSKLPNKFMMENFGVDFMGLAFIFKSDHSKISKDEVTVKGRDRYNLENCYICKNYLVYDEKLDRFHKFH
ncbi:hypothetical protein RCL_jg14161.t1 [Rhizophagus clarus]|uniref:Uncharacterized protein n=1 Tax=Rhizophagus clarus TaxID=94130 RepID=A0A8H3M0A6_9GLOM|nr:hypothetical protein RCL_jg14161.t1 [Rhizophagus clarus]